MQVILVDENDVAVGVEEKLKAHREGLLHRAFSVFVFNPDGDMLLQQRAFDKYHSGGLWTNACCSHPGPGETIEEAAHRRLREEMAFDCPLAHAFSFVYRAILDKGLIEHEYDHVLVGRFDGTAHPNPREAAGAKWVPVAGLVRDVNRSPQAYTYWFKAVLERALRYAPDYLQRP